MKPEYIPLYIIIIILIWRILRYISTPVLKKAGIYKYYSPMFMVVPRFGNTLDIHLGTSYDFFRQKNISARLILQYVAEGITRLCDDIAAGKIKPNAKLYGNSFYFKKESLEKFGFKTRPMNLFETILFCFIYFEVSILRSITMRKISFVPVSHVFIISSTAGDLLKYRDRFHALTNVKTSAIN